MNTKNIIDNALNLSAAEKIVIIEMLSKSLSEPNKEIEELWKDEAERRYHLYSSDKIKSIPYSEILKNENRIS